MTAITQHSMVQVVNDQISADLKGAAVVLQLTEGVYYQLSDVGGHVWARINEQPHQVRALVDAVMDKYDVDRSRCEADVVVLLQDMLERGLVEITEPKE
jgi:hypothetical protein